MTGASIVTWKEGDAVVLAVHGAFDGASAWALRVAMEDSPAARFVVDLTHAVEACEFAAGILAQFVHERRRDKRVAFRPGTAEHVALLSRFGLELAGVVPPIAAPVVPTPWSNTGTPVVA
jgi:peptidoglycan/LPS O-acetylase OafA/YrhL